MKCKVCGYEFDPGRGYCPMCGSKVPEEIRRKEEEEMSWNTYDFPKAKKPEDIEMHWPSMSSRPESSVSVMNKDASEGFVRAASPAKAEPEQPKKPEAPMPDPWAQVSREFPHVTYPAQEPAKPAQQPMPPFPSAPVFQPAPQPAQQPAPQPAASAPQSAPQPEPAPQPAKPQQSAFPQGAWQMPQMQETPSWTPYNVQAPQQTMQMPPIPPTYVPSSFTQAYGAQYSQPQYTQPQTAWTVPPQPAPGTQVFVTQPAQPVFIQPAPVTPVTPPVYSPVYPQYTQPMPPVQPAPQPEPAPAPEPAPQAEPAPAPEPVPQPEPEPAPAPAEEPKEKVLEENIVATIGKPAEKPVEEPVPAPVIEPEPVPVIPASPEPEPGEDGRYPERFFTFNKKNEEFQKLLDQQLERVHNLHGGDYHEDLSHTFVYKKNTFQPTPAQNFFHSDDLDPDLTEFEKMLFESTKDAEGDETLAINRDRIKGAALSAEDLIEPLPVKEGDTHPLGEPVPAQKEEPVEPAEPEVPLTKEELARKEHRERMARMAKAREEYFSSLRMMTAEQRAVREKDMEEFRARLTAETRVSPDMVTREKAPEKTPEQTAAEKAEEARLAAERETAEREAAIERAKAEMEAAKEAQRKELEKEQQESASEADALDEALQQAGAAEEESEVPAEPEEPAVPEETPEEETPARDKTEVLGEVLDDVEEENQKREKREHSHWFLKFLLALLIVVGAAEGGTVALRHYAPDSPASIITTSIE